MVVIALGGCATSLIRTAYNEAGLDVYGCFTLAGPPPAGGTTWVLVPKGVKPAISFAGMCALVMR